MKSHNQINNKFFDIRDSSKKWTPKTVIGIKRNNNWIIIMINNKIININYQFSFNFYFKDSQLTAAFAQYVEIVCYFQSKFYVVPNNRMR